MKNPVYKEKKEGNGRVKEERASFRLVVVSSVGGHLLGGLPDEDKENIGKISKIGNEKPKNSSNKLANLPVSDTNCFSVAFVSGWESKKTPLVEKETASKFEETSKRNQKGRQSKCRQAKPRRIKWVEPAEAGHVKHKRKRK